MHHLLAAGERNSTKWLPLPMPLPEAVTIANDSLSNHVCVLSIVDRNVRLFFVDRCATGNRTHRSAINLRARYVYACLDWVHSARLFSDRHSGIGLQSGLHIPMSAVFFAFVVHVERIVFRAFVWQFCLAIVLGWLTIWKKECKSLEMLPQIMLESLPRIAFESHNSNDKYLAIYSD